MATAEDRIKMECDKCGYKCIPQWIRSSVANVESSDHPRSPCELSCNEIRARLQGYRAKACWPIQSGTPRLNDKAHCLKCQAGSLSACHEEIDVGFGCESNAQHRGVT